MKKTAPVVANAHLVKILRVAVLRDIYHEQIQSSSGQKSLVHSGIVHLSGTIEKLHRSILEPMAKQLDPNGASLSRCSLRWGPMTRNDALHQTAIVQHGETRRGKPPEIRHFSEGKIEAGTCLMKQNTSV